ncbi:MAG: ABC transporter permease [Fusobacteriota bacterium]
MNIILSLIFGTIRQAAPLLITAIGGIFSEITGVVNIGLEGMMLIGAFSGAVASYYTGSAVMGVIFAMIAGGLLALIHAILSVKYKGNQVVSGVAINLFAAGFTVFMLRILFQQSGNSPTVTSFPKIFGISGIIFIIYGIAIAAHFFIYKTVTGLRMRSVGEHPLAADTVGIDVYKIRYFGVIMSGVFAGLGGAYLSLGALSQFTKGMSSGRGFIALAAMIFGKWTPFGALGASLLFGFSMALQGILQQHVTVIPPQFIQMIPYILTLLALAGVVGKSKAPSASGTPYDKSNE